jgi:hypothetical protein
VDENYINIIREASILTSIYTNGHLCCSVRGGNGETGKIMSIKNLERKQPEEEDE